jgi:hypothetical protein
VVEQLDPVQLMELHSNVTQARDAVAHEINRLDADPPEDEQEFNSAKTWLMAMWRELSILRVQIAYVAPS